VPSGRAFKKHTRIIRIARGTGTQAQQHAGERLVAQVQAVVQLPLERGAVQEREEKVDTRKVEVHEVVDQVRVGETETWPVSTDGSAFPLSCM